MQRTAVALSLVALSTPAFAKILGPDVSAEALEITKNVRCGEADGEPAVYYRSGNVYSRLRGEPDRPSFRGEGRNTRQCTTVSDPVLGEGYRQISRELMFYRDPATGQILRIWDSPGTGETVEVMQIANDPVNQPP